MKENFPKPIKIFDEHGVKLFQQQTVFIFIKDKAKKDLRNLFETKRGWKFAYCSWSSQLAMKKVGVQNKSILLSLTIN